MDSGVTPSAARNDSGLCNDSRMMIGVLLGSVAVVLVRMKRMAVRDLGMMRRLLVIAVFRVLGRLAMVLRGVLVMLGGLVVVFVDFVGAHGSSPEEADAREPSRLG